MDARSKRIRAVAKSGCCWHVTEQPEDSAGVLVTTEKLVGGKWITSTRTVPRNP